MSTAEYNSKDLVHQIWDQIFKKIEDGAGSVSMTGVFSRAVPLSMTDTEYTIGVHNKFNHDLILRFHADTVTGILQEITGSPLILKVVIDDSLAEKMTANEPISVEAIQMEEPREVKKVDDGGYNPKYSFDSFIVGDTNNFAYSAALAVAEQPGLKYNPLFIWGDSGLGKTHLLHAIGSYISSSFPNKKVRYITTEELVSRFTTALSQKGSKDSDVEYIRNYYRGSDVLMIDDIQFLHGKTATIDFFFHTYNHLREKGKQIIIAADRSPQELKMDDRLKSRFTQGLIVDIQPPTYEVRLAILKRYTSLQKVSFTPESIYYVAEKAIGNIREMEGAITRATAYAELSNKNTVDLKLIEAVTVDYFPVEVKRPISIATIQKEVSKYYGISLNDLLGAKRKQDIVFPRHIAMYLCSELTEASYPKIGSEFGGKDHTTVMHAAAKIKKKMGSETEVFNQIELLTSAIHKRPI